MIGANIRDNSQSRSERAIGQPLCNQQRSNEPPSRGRGARQERSDRIKERARQLFTTIKAPSVAPRSRHSLRRDAAVISASAPILVVLGQTSHSLSPRMYRGVVVYESARLHGPFIVALLR